MKLAAATYIELLHVVRNVSPLVRREIFAESGTEDPGAFTRRLLALNGPLNLVAITEDGEPVASIGAVARSSAYWWPWCFATPRFPAVALSMTRYVRKELFPTLCALGMRRADCYSLEANTEAQKWLVSIGGRRSGEPFKYGKNADSFVRFVWYNPDNQDKVIRHVSPGPDGV